MLNQDQQAALGRLSTFVFDDSRELVLSGAAGTGKSYLINQFLQGFPSYVALGKAVASEDFPETLMITATTNKAVSALQSQLSSLEEVKTVHSALGIRPLYDFSTKKTKLILTDKNTLHSNLLIIIDEYSYIDKDLYNIIHKNLRNCKILYVGDSYQLPPIGSDLPYIDVLGIEKVELTQIMRQTDNNPIQALSRDLRESVKSKTALPRIPLGTEIMKVDRTQFQQMLVNDLRTTTNIKYLAHSNKAVQHYNKNLYQILQSQSESYNKGDIVQVNRFISNDRVKLKPEMITSVDDISYNTKQHIEGTDYLGIDLYIEGYWFFMPYNVADYDKALDSASPQLAQVIQEEWIDVRHAYACTIHKSQGSTFKKAYIDLHDMSFIYNRDRELFKRLLYVAVSRAKEQVIFTGDIG